MSHGWTCHQCASINERPRALVCQVCQAFRQHSAGIPSSPANATEIKSTENKRVQEVVIQLDSDSEQPDSKKMSNFSMKSLFSRLYTKKAYEIVQKWHQELSRK